MPNCNETINLITTTPNKLPPLLSPRLIKTGHDKVRTIITTVWGRSLSPEKYIWNKEKETILIQEIHLDQWHTNPLFSSTTKKWNDPALRFPNIIAPCVKVCTKWTYDALLIRSKKKLLPSKVILPPRATLSTPKRNVSFPYSLETLYWLFILFF